MTYSGKWIHIDLSSGHSKTGTADVGLYDSYIGGKGVGFALLDSLAPKPEPLGSDNPLIFVNGPFTGTRIQTSARTCLVTCSPLTHNILDSHCGGHFGPRLRAAGFDYVLITGKADHPVTIQLSPRGAEIQDASSLWGKGIFETTETLLAAHPGRNPRVACIGPAGEKLLKIACIGVDKYRQYGRGGAGAVMGSKNLKALVVDGDLQIEYADPNAFKELNRALTHDIARNESVLFRRDKGTMKCVRSGQEFEFLPTRNFQLCRFDEFEGISSETCRRELNWEDTGCFNCAIQCSKIARWDGHEVEGPEYETAAFLGSGCGIGDCRDLALANELCDDWGIDTISAGVTCSFAMECYEKGLLKDWEGLKLEWGNADAQRKLLRLMVQRKSVGKIFADGTREAAQWIGQGSEDFAVNIHGMELSGVNPKGSLTMGVVLSVADFASHTRLWCTEAEMGPEFRIDDIPTVVADGLDEINARNCLIICDFVPYGFDRLAPLLNAATGSSHTPESLLQIGTRLTHLARRYNLNNGRTHEDDILPERFFKEPSLSGFMRGRILDKTFFRSLIQKYYRHRDWNAQGIPSPEVLRSFGLSS